MTDELLTAVAACAPLVYVVRAGRDNELRMVGFPERLDAVVGLRGVIYSPHSPGGGPPKRVYRVDSVTGWSTELTPGDYAVLAHHHLFVTGSTDCPPIDPKLPPAEEHRRVCAWIQEKTRQLRDSG